MKEYKVKLTEYAENQLRDTLNYIAVTLTSPIAAKNWLSNMKRQMSQLSFMPQRVVLTDEEPWHSRGIHKLVVKNHLVYFWIDEDHSVVWVIAVVYGRMEQTEQLKRIDFEF